MTEIDKQRAVINPSSEFDAPKDVVEDKNLSKPQKKKALAEWELDARLMQVAAEEGMTGGAPNRLKEVKKAQTELGVKPKDDTGTPPPTKTG